MVLLIYLALIITVHPYNIDIIDPLSLTGKSPGEYFGYSTAVQISGTSRWVLVGAPTANITLKDGTNGASWGSVYNCSSGEGDSGYQCKEVIVDNIPAVKDEVKEGQWTGVTLSVDPTTSDAVTCAHRYTKRGIMNTDNEVGMRGRCWIIKPDGKTKLLPDLCVSIYMAVDSDRCSAGISSSYDNNEFFAVGGVGYQNWKGRTMFYDSKIGANALQSVSIDGIRSRTYDYFGYSTASCYDKKDKFTYLFVSAPRSKNIRGKVDYIKYYGSVYNGVIQSQFAMGHQIGSYFGASVTCGYTKLSTVQVIIGAPSHSDNTISGDYDRGKIYVYQVNKYAPGKPSFPRAQLTGFKSGSRFGAVVSVIGDINKDGLDDLAVGAPSDLSPDAGRVYIYLGAKKGFTTFSKPVQIISPLPVAKAPLYGFGSSVSGGSDIDDNGYPDMVVGAFHSDKAFVYRTAPIINIDIKQTFPNMAANLIDKNDPCPNENVTVACFNLHFCVKYLPEPGQKVDASRGFSIRVTNSLDTENDIYTKRVRFSEEKTYVVHENFTDYMYGSEKEMCSHQKIFLEEEITNIAQLISIKTEATVLPSLKFENRLALNVSRYPYAISQVKIKTACANATCETDLRLTSPGVILDKAEVGTRAGVLYPGFNELIWCNYSITRNISLGKPFGSHVLITMPASMYIKNVRGADGTKLSICTPFSVREGNYYCGLDERMDTNETQFNFSVEYSVTGVKAEGAKEVIIRTELVTEGSEDKHPENNVMTQNIILRRLARLELQGTSSRSKVPFEIRDKETNVNFVSDISKSGALETQFFPINYGPGELHDLELIIEVPFAVNSTQNEDFIYPYKVDSSTDIVCEEDLLNVHNVPTASKTKRTKRSSRLPRPSTLGEIQDSLLADPRPDKDTVQRVSYECERDVHCINISCTIAKLTKDIVGIRLTSYVWELTFQEPIRINTSVRAWVANKDSGADLTSNSLTGPVLIPLQVIAVADLVRPVSIWIIVGSITGGLCFLSLIVIILYKVGFFNRNRPPAEFYGKENPGVTIEVTDDSHDLAVEPYIQDSEDDEAQFAFTNPLCEELNM